MIKKTKVLFWSPKLRKAYINGKDEREEEILELIDEEIKLIEKEIITSRRKKSGTYQNHRILAKNRIIKFKQKLKERK